MTQWLCNDCGVGVCNDVDGSGCGVDGVGNDVDVSGIIIVMVHLIHTQTTCCWCMHGLDGS